MVKKFIKIRYNQKLQMMKNTYRILLFLISITLIISCDNYNSTTQTQKSNRWSEEKIWNWYNNQPWPVGTNFIISSSINQLEFWQEETFDPDLI